MTDHETNEGFSPLPEIFEELRAGRMVVLVDDPRRENEGDLVMAAEFVTPEAVNFMISYARGQVCVPLTEDRAEALELRPQVTHNTSAFGTGFTVSVDARTGISTGISAHDRAETIRLIVDPQTKPKELARPGHVFPILARPGGVLERAGQTEGSVDLCRLAGLQEVAVICEILGEDGRARRVPQLRRYCKDHDLKMCSVADIIEFRRQQERLIVKGAVAKLPTVAGKFDLHVYETVVHKVQHVALTLGLPVHEEGNPVPAIDEPVLVRVHSECLTGDVFGSRRCDCGEQLHAALRQIHEAGRGVLLYMRQEGRGIGLMNKIKAYALQEHGYDTVQANEELGFAPDIRNYGVGAQILFDLGVRSMRLLTNNPKKFRALTGYGLSIVERIAIEATPNEQNEAYLTTKREKLGHVLEMRREPERAGGSALDGFDGAERERA